MNEILSFAGSYWWLVFPVSGVFAVWGRSWSEATERRHRRKIELYRLKHPGAVHAQPVPQLEEREPTRTRIERDIALVGRMHDEVDRRWLTCEL